MVDSVSDISYAHVENIISIHNLDLNQYGIESQSNIFNQPYYSKLNNVLRRNTIRMPIVMNHLSYLVVAGIATVSRLDGLHGMAKESNIAWKVLS